ncbi:MAG: shikimate kinase [Pseudobdellovibrionaceae bacterium]
MKLVLLGHRGTGKSQLLERLKTYWKDKSSNLKFFDLDREIEFREGKTISQIFNDAGEKDFRDLEVNVFHDLIRANPEFVISMGAGFPLQHIPADIQRLWVRRKTDFLGRIFLNRPRLNPEMSPLEEYLQRLPLREERYRKHSTDEYLMPEGIESANSIEERIFKEDYRNLGGVLTLLPIHFRSLESLQNRIRNFDVDFFELRDDLLSLQQIQMVTSLLPPRRVLLSLRSAKTNPWIQEFLRTGISWDWALELGACPFGEAPIFSLHQVPRAILQSKESLETFLAEKKIPATSHIKLSPIIESFSELQILLNWQNENPSQRSVLPRSQAGRWGWIRLWLKGRQKINFFRLDQGSALDQPTLFEWMSTPFQIQNFAALLGHPVFHSRTPIEHQAYFQKKGWPVFAIDIEEEEFQKAIELLSFLGLQAAAVTSPLKVKAFQWAQERSPIVQELESANTLFFKDQKWSAHNTDLDGFRFLFSQITGDTQSLAVWGGGGTLPVILKIAPNAIFFSARTGELKREYGDQQKWTRDQIVSMQMEGPRILIWAASPEAQLPPEDWRPEFVLDLNYREDSLAREYALQVNAQYLDGLGMFKEQARAQREFWDR